MIQINRLGTDRILTPKHLSFLLGIRLVDLEKYSQNITKHYHPFKKRYKKTRFIANPDNGLKAIQRQIINKIFNKVPLPDEIYGARKGHNIKQNASVHRNQPVLVTIDIKNCFPSVSHLRVFKLFREDFGYSEEVANLLTKLTTFRRSLPHGGVTSAMLLNIMLIPFCNKLKMLTHNHQLSFWVDDITLSGKDAHLHCQEIISELHKFGFKTRSKKVKVMFNNRQQITTGLLTNKYVSIPHQKILHYLENHEVCKKETTEGRISFITSINQKQGVRFKKRIST